MKYYDWRLFFCCCRCLKWCQNNKEIILFGNIFYYNNCIYQNLCTSCKKESLLNCFFIYVSSVNICPYTAIDRGVRDEWGWSIESFLCFLISNKFKKINWYGYICFLLSRFQHKLKIISFDEFFACWFLSKGFSTYFKFQIRWIRFETFCFNAL